MDDPQTRLIKRHTALLEERSSWIAHYQEISDFLLPRAGRFFTSDRNRGEKRHNNIYDNSATRALHVLGAGLMSGATSPARPWFRLATHDPELMKRHAVKQWLSDVAGVMRNIFARSNTYRVLHMMYEELGAFGTAATFIMDDYESVVCGYPLTAGEYAIATDYKGNVNTLSREYEKQVSAIVGEFGYANCSSRVQGMYDRGDLDKWVKILHIVEPRADRDPNSKLARDMPYRSTYMELDAPRGGKLLRDGGFKRFRALCPRWSVFGGDIYGHSPAMEALGDIKQLQHEQLRKAQGIDYQTDPPLQVPTILKNRPVDRLPGGVAFVDNTGANTGIRSMFEVNLNLQHLLMDIQDVRDRIRQAFYSDLFMMLANSTTPQMTATEVAERHEEKLTMLGPVLERLQNELLSPLVDITFERAIMARGPDGRPLLPPPPDEMQGEDLNVEFVSMLAQAQRAINTNAVDRFVTNLGAIAAAKPGVLDKFNEDKWADQYADMLGVDPELIVGDEQVAIIRAERAKQQAAAQQAAAAEQAASTVNKLGNTPTSGDNALTDAISMFSGYTG